jgi:hypothetical protein
MEKLAKQSMREYNYIYTGKNIDVTNFKLNFNNLFFEAVPARLGNTGGPPSRNSAAPTDKPNIKSTTSESDIDRAQETGLPGHPVQTTADLTNDMENSGGQTQQSAYFAMAQAMHSAIVDSTSNMLTGEIEIVGDPYWMVDSGVSNYFARTSLKSRFLTEDGTLNYVGGDVFIFLTFRTPADIDEKTGLYQWPTKGKESPFSGIFRVTQCENIFNDGIFKQKLTCARQPGQSQDFKNSNPNNIANLANDKSKQLAVQSNGQEEKPKTNPAEEYAVNDKGEGIY